LILRQPPLGFRTPPLDEVLRPIERSVLRAELRERVGFHGSTYWCADVSVALIDSGAHAAILRAIATPASSAASGVAAICCVMPIRYDSSAVQ